METSMMDGLLRDFGYDDRLGLPAGIRIVVTGAESYACDRQDEGLGPSLGRRESGGDADGGGSLDWAGRSRPAQSPG
jgi:hypothetical protein